MDRVTARGSQMLERVLVAVALGTSIAALSLIAAVPSPPLTVWGVRGFSVIIAVAFSGVGYVVTTRRRDNPIGSILLVVAAGGGTQLLCDEYGIFDAYGPARLPGANAVAWLGGWLWTVILGLVAGPLLALFPNGRLVSPGWVWVHRLAAVTTVITAAAMAFLRDPMPSGLANPLRLPVDESAEQMSDRTLYLFVIVALGSVASLVVRYQRARSDERHQLKWLAAAGAFLPITLVAQFLSDGSTWSEVATIVSLAMVPVAIGIAILRYRLYEIDTIISHAMVYGLLTALLGGGFVAAQNVVPRVVAATVGVSSDIVTVALVFVVATVFTPLRVRLQAAVDRRFKLARGPDEDGEGDAVAARLRALARLREEGLITTADYEQKKRDFLAHF